MIDLNLTLVSFVAAELIAEEASENESGSDEEPTVHDLEWSSVDKASEFEPGNTVLIDC